jgi:hypothetical protein
MNFLGCIRLGQWAFSASSELSTVAYFPVAVSNKLQQLQITELLSQVQLLSGMAEKQNEQTGNDDIFFNVFNTSRANCELGLLLLRIASEINQD